MNNNKIEERALNMIPLFELVRTWTQTGHKWLGHTLHCIVCTAPYSKVLVRKLLQTKNPKISHPSGKLSRVVEWRLLQTILILGLSPIPLCYTKKSLSHIKTTNIEAWRHTVIRSEMKSNWNSRVGVRFEKYSPCGNMPNSYCGLPLCCRILVSGLSLGSQNCYSRTL